MFLKKGDSFEIIIIQLVTRHMSMKTYYQIWSNWIAGAGRNVSKSLVYSWGFIRDPVGGFTTLLCKDTWNLAFVHLRKIPRSAGRKFRFSLQLLYSKMHGFKYEFSKFFWGGAHRAPSPDPSPRSISGFAVDSRALCVLGLGCTLNSPLQHV